MVDKITLIESKIDNRRFISIKPMYLEKEVWQERIQLRSILSYLFNEGDRFIVYGRMMSFFLAKDFDKAREAAVKYIKSIDKHDLEFEYNNDKITFALENVMCMDEVFDQLYDLFIYFEQITVLKPKQNPFHTLSIVDKLDFSLSDFFLVKNASDRSLLLFVKSEFDTNEFIKNVLE